MQFKSITYTNKTGESKANSTKQNHPQIISIFGYKDNQSHCVSKIIPRSASYWDTDKFKKLQMYGENSWAYLETRKQCKSVYK